MTPWIEIILKLFWFMLPAGIANMTPVLVKKINFLNTPMDFGRSWRGKRIFGAHKTWRGLFFGTVAAMITIQLQQSFDFNIAQYTGTNILLIGFLLGFGALMGDAVKSFFKRRANVKPGKQWIPWDQIDWVLGSLLFFHFYQPVSLTALIIALLLFGLLHPVVNMIGYHLKIKKNKF